MTPRHFGILPTTLQFVVLLLDAVAFSSSSTNNNFNNGTINGSDALSLLPSQQHEGIPEALRKVIFFKMI
jgi:hypothetical protein